MSEMIEELVEITAETHDVLIDLRYATENNVTGQAFYCRAACFLHPKAEAALIRAVALAKVQGWRIKIFDAFRPLEAQQFLWDDCPDAEFVSNPKTGSCPHCRGVAVDLTLVDVEGNELDMGTGFDDFTHQSHHGDGRVSVEAQRNRYLLMGIMTTAGWDFYRNEWWHYQLFNAREYHKWTDIEAGTRMV